MPVLPDHERVRQYRGAIDRFDGWIERNLARGDRAWQRPTSADAYFSLVVYASYIGRRDWVHRALEQVQQRFMGPDGLKQGPNRDQMIPYVPSWIAWAALDAERFELSTKLLDGVRAFQHEASGGFFAGGRERADQRGALDFDSTTMGIIALARGGRAAPARRGADFLLRLWQAQPARDERFCTAWDEPDGLRSEGPGDATVLRWAQPKQHYYKVGLYVQALVNVYGVTGERKYLDTAVDVYGCTVSRAAHLWTSTLSHKMCWAATTLHAITGEADYVDHARRLADHIMSTQQPDGAFTYPELWPSYPPERWEMIPNVGCQFALWIARVLRMLESRLEPEA